MLLNLTIWTYKSYSIKNPQDRIKNRNNHVIKRLKIINRIYQSLVSGTIYVINTESIAIIDR